MKFFLVERQAGIMENGTVKNRVGLTGRLGGENGTEAGGRSVEVRAESWRCSRFFLLSFLRNLWT